MLCKPIYYIFDVSKKSPFQVLGFEVLCFCSLYEVAKVGQHFDYGVKCMPDRVWPPVIGKQTECSKAVGHIWRPTGASLVMQSSISCIKMVGKHSPCTIDDQSAIQHVLYPFIISDIYDYVALLLDMVTENYCTMKLFLAKDVLLFSYVILSRLLFRIEVL